MNGIGLKRGKAFLAQPSVLKRIIAFITDLFIVNLIILFPFKRIFDSIIPATGSFSETLDFLSANADYTSSMAVIVILAAALTMLYFIIMEKRLGQTPGKMLFNLYFLYRELCRI